MNFRILGPLEVLDNERVLDVGGGKQRSVLALLLLHANEAVSGDRLIDELWPDDPPPSAAKIVQVHVSRLRKALDGAGEGILLTRGRGYVLRVQPGQLDRDRFQAMVEEGRAALAAGDPDKAGETLRAALALWRGPPLEEFAYDSFAQTEIARLDELHVAALEERIEADLALSRHDAVVQELEQLVGRYPLRERLRGQLMLALYRTGRQAEALEVYRDGRRTLADELGLEPSPTLQQLERAILAHDDAVQAPTRGSARGAAKRKGGILVTAGAAVLLAAAITVAVIEMTGTESAGLRFLAADSVGAIDPETNKIVDQIPVGSAPTRVAIDEDSVWVISRQDETVTRIDQKTRTALRTLPVGGPPMDLAVGDNAVWLLVSSHAAGDGQTRIARIDPRLNVALPMIPLGAGPYGFGSTEGGGSLATAGGAVWAVNPYPRITVSRIDGTTNTVSATFSVGGLSLGFNSGTAGGVPGVSGLAVGHGALWVAGDRGVVRIATGSKTVSATIQLGVAIPTALAVGDDAVWVAARPGFRCCPPETVGTGTITRLSTKTNSVEATIPIGGNPAAIAVGDDAIWIADPGTRSVIRVDPKKNRVVARIRVGARPRGIAVGDGSVWVSVS